MCSSSCGFWESNGIVGVGVFHLLGVCKLAVMSFWDTCVRSVVGLGVCGWFDGVCVGAAFGGL